MENNQQDRILVFWLVLILSHLPMRGSSEESIDCSFNSMCTCIREENQHEGHLQSVNCLDVPFYKIPNIPDSSVTQLEIVGAKVSSIEADSIPFPVQALILSNNQIQHISEKALSLSAKSLTSLDLSYNRLDSAPFQTLRELINVQWINLHGNQISSIIGDWSGMKSSLTTLFLGENDITELSGDTPYSTSQHLTSLRQLKELIWLNLDGNRIHKIHKHYLPANLKTLSISYNLIENFPLDVILYMPHLQWLYLRGNNIKNIPKYTFAKKLYLEKIDLGENYLKDCPRMPFNNSIVIKDLNLASNNFKTLTNDAFFGLETRRIIFTYNSISYVEPNAFRGIDTTLEYLDLDHNNLKGISNALKGLSNLKYLYLSANELGNLPGDALYGIQNTLRAISISYNKFVKIPKNALENCTKISYFNVAFNEIYQIDSTDFDNWGLTLQTLVLNNNRISFLNKNTFSGLSQLKELSLCYNAFAFIEEGAFSGLKNLESLELTFSIDKNEVPHEVFKDLKNLKSLLLDHNNFHDIYENSFDSLAQLNFLNLDSNKIQIIPISLFKSSIHKNLRDIRLSYNEINVILSKTFNTLSNLEIIFLTDNKITNIKTESFSSMPQIKQIALSHNKINLIEPWAFKNLTSLNKVDLHHNQLKEIYFNVFDTLGNRLYLNLSHNSISNCYPGTDFLHIYVLDMSHNSLFTIPSCLRKTKNLRKLYLDYNKITTINYNDFKDLVSVKTITLSQNGILAIDSAGFYKMNSLQILDLSQNFITYLHTAQFSDNPNLRILNLSGNNLNNLPKDVFANTALELIDLSLNSLNYVPSTSLSDVKLSLRHLLLKQNNLEHLDITTFPDFPFLHHLDLSYNKLTILPDNVFSSLSLLQTLDLSSNPLRANFKELLHYARNLRELNLANVGMLSTPQLPLPNLIYLNLSSNNLEHINRNTFQDLERLKVLDLSNCNLIHVPNHVWGNLPNLKKLDISHNPIKEITVDSFQSLKSLRILNIHHLRRLQKFEGKSVTQLRILSKLYVQTLPSLKDFYKEFCYILTHLTQLKVLKVTFQEHELNDQLACLSHKKLNNLEILGRNLRIIDRNALASLNKNPNLSIKISGTLINELPSGLFSHMGKIPYLAIDLSHNMLSVLNPDTFYGNSTTWDTVGTSVIIGGLNLAGNRFRCGCHLAWLGHWLRRWTRESLEGHTESAELSFRVQAMSKEATCWDSSLERHIPIVKLPPVDMSCQASALSSEGDTTKFGGLVILFVIFLSVVNLL